MDIEHLHTINVVTSKFDSVDEQNELIGRISAKNCDVVITMEGQGNDTLNIVAHKVQENKGQYYVHFGPHGVITSNSTAILMKINNISSHKVLCTDGKSMSCAIFSACRGLVNDKIKDGINEQRVMDASQEFVVANIGEQDCIEDLTTMNKSSTKCHEEDEQLVAWDDVTGTMLDPDLVMEARKAEMVFFKKMNVCEKVPKSDCYKETGKAPIGVRWVDVNKQDEKDPLYRSRLVAKDYNNSKEPDLYTATPALEFLRLIVSLAASFQDKCGRPWKIVVNDVNRAYFYAPSLKPTFVQICAEDFEPGDEHRCGKLLVSMYGTRPAAGNWQRCYTDVLKANGFTTSPSSTRIFYHPTRRIMVFVHSDDFVSTSSGAELGWLEAALERKFEIKSKTIGHDVGDRTEVKILNRVISVTQQGFRYEPDLRHVELVVSELGLENAKSVSTLWTDACDSCSLLDAEHFKKYQSISARVNLLAQDRMDFQFAAKECARKMSKPTIGDW